MANSLDLELDLMLGQVELGVTPLKCFSSRQDQ